MDSVLENSCFDIFLNKTPLFGKNIICLDDKNLQGLKKNSRRQNFITYGFGQKADFVPVNVVYKDMQIHFDLKVNLKKKFIIKDIALNLMGKHNILNATSAIILALTLNIPIKKIKKTLKNFSGVQRKLCELLFLWNKW